uniref:Microsomal glutathione S-transferase 1 n=1 Tax=Ciona savignyi TaxID=51511 RepID=H2Y962_CIOSA
MSVVTIYHRLMKGSFPAEEDAKLMAHDQEKIKEMLKPNDDVERLRNAHLNDLENVVPFVLLGLLYISTNPPAATAPRYFRCFSGRVYSSQLLTYSSCVLRPEESGLALVSLQRFQCYTAQSLQFIKPRF